MLHVILRKIYHWYIKYNQFYLDLKWKINFFHYFDIRMRTVINLLQNRPGPQVFKNTLILNIIKEVLIWKTHSVSWVVKNLVFDI